jgi:hypothetical protein
MYDQPDYRLQLIQRLPQLQSLDGIPITASERARAQKLPQHVQVPEQAAKLLDSQGGGACIFVDGVCKPMASLGLGHLVGQGKAKSNI